MKEFTLISLEMLQKLHIQAFVIADACDIPNATMKELLKPGTNAAENAVELLTAKQMDRLNEICSIIRMAYRWATNEENGMPVDMNAETDGYIIEIMSLLEALGQIGINTISVVCGIEMEKLIQFKTMQNTGSASNVLTSEEKTRLAFMLFRFYYALNREYHFTKLPLPDIINYEKPFGASIAATIGKQKLGVFIDHTPKPDAAENAGKVFSAEDFT